jgi:hypothetical protein
MFKFLTTDGLIFMILGWGFVFGLLGFSVLRILKNEKNAK